MAITSLVTILVAAAAMSRVISTPLDDYVNTPDPMYSYKYLKTVALPGLSVHIVNMTSQKWLTDEVTTNPIWWHYLIINIPDVIQYWDTAFMWIGEHSNNPNSIPSLDDDQIQRMISLCESTGSVTALIENVPNQPIVFQDDPQKKRRVEDAIIAWTWKKFLQNGSNPEILLRLPMTKSVVRGMDTVTSYVKGLTGNLVDKFVVAGESKRGWTTWTTTAVDKRVIGMVPTVMDLLHLHKNLHHHYRSLGGWTFAFDDYFTENITTMLDSPNIPKLQAVVDPISYNDRFTMPKLVVTTGGDEFFLVDDSHYYYDELQSPKYLRIIPNAEHSMTGHKISYVLTIRAFYLNLLAKLPYPEVTWVRTQTGTGGKITMKTSVKPATVIVHYAKTTDGKRRDFRLAIRDPNGSDEPYPHPVIWFEQNPKKISDLEYEAEFDRPALGWLAFFIQVTFDGAKNSTLEFTTEACIVPDTFPFPECSGESCYGSLV